jgi:phosphodiesterase/alkaline phosphatase D-like protein
VSHAFSTRRDFLRQIAAAGVVLPACGDNLEAAPAVLAAFEVDATSAVITAWSPGDAVRIRVIDDTTGADVADLDAEVGASGVVHVDVTGLVPGRRYRYGAADTIDAVFTTAPAEADSRPVRLAVSADLDVDPLFDSPILDTMADVEPELFVSLGDWPYADNAPGAVTLDQYRRRHLEARTAPKVQRWLRTVGIRAIYDDHEFRNDWDAERAAREPDRYAAALAAWDEWFPVRGAPDGSRYRAWRWGAHVECFLLDCRRHRVANTAADGPAKTMLGAAQRAWLLAGLAASTAPFKLVFTGVPLAYGWGDDHWAAYTWEREQILRGVRDAGIRGVLFLSGDQHWFGAHVHDFGAREMQVGPLARGIPVPPLPVAGVLTTAAVYNFGLLDIDGQAIQFRAIGATGDVLYEEELTADGLLLS